MEMKYLRERGQYTAVKWIPNESNPYARPFVQDEHNIDGDQECVKCKFLISDHGIFENGGRLYPVCPGDWVIDRNNFRQIITENQLKIKFEEIEVHEADESLHSKN